MKCQRCGNDNPEDTQFCGGCGASLSESTVNGSAGEEATGLPMVSFLPAIKLGFQNYVNEWWHYTLIEEPYPDTFFDIPIE